MRFVCPECGSDNVVFNPFNCRCKDCGHKGTASEFRT